MIAIDPNTLYERARCFDPLAIHMALTPKQKQFAKEYIVDLNATAAAIRAGYAKKSAVKSGYRNMQNEDVVAGIRKAQEARAERTEISADRVLKEIAALAFVDPSTILRKTRHGVTITETSKLTDAQRRCIQSLSETTNGEIKCRLTDKIRALELLGKHLGLFLERHEHSGPGGGPMKVQAMSDEELEQIARGEGA